MGYKCDVCQKDEGAVFCFADQAVMCQGCDHRVHSANKLAKKHERVALEKEAEPATCDICQEHKAIMFCAEDRALICRRCDLMIHTANEFTSKHHRYLLFGMAVGLKALGESNSEASGSDAGTSTATETGTIERPERTNKETPYSLRNSAASSGRTTKEEPWRISTDRASWRAGKPPRANGNALEEGATLAHAANGASGSGSQLSSKPSSGNLLERPGRGGIGHSPSLGALTGASLLTPFGAPGEQAQEPQEPALEEELNGGGGASTSAAAGATGGWGLDSMLRGNSDFTLAAELLGVPTVSQGFSAKDIDAAYIFDDDVDLDANLSALLEVPDLDFLQQDPSILFPNPSSSRPANNTAGLGGSGGMNGKAGADNSSADGVVPDMGMGSKRQRVL